MKKILIYIFLSILIAGMISCEDNELFSELHNLTPEEEAEIARQDSIEKAEREKINANLILEYTVEIKTSAASYDGAPVAIEIDKIAELFGLSEAEILAGIAGESGAPDIKGFAIEGSTHADIGSASNTNAPWGHWWDRRGDLSEWGDSAMVFAEFDTENALFNVGQYPEHLTEGQAVRFIEALKFNDLRVAIVITVNAVAPVKLEVGVVNTLNLAIDVLPMDSYDAEALDFDIDQVLSDLGISTMEEASFVGVNEDGSFAEEYTADPSGFWYDMGGFASSWGDDASVYVTYEAFEANQIGIGQYPEHLVEGQTLVIGFGFLANDKIVMLNITLNVVGGSGFVDPETPPSGSPEIVEESIEVSAEYVVDYSSTTVDVKELLRNAFKMTTYQINSAIENGELIFSGVNADGSVYTDENGTIVSTANYPGHWFTANGDVCSWGDEAIIFCELTHDNENLNIAIGNHPDNAKTGDVITFKQIAELNGGKVTFTITFTITDASGGGPQTLEKSYDVTETYNTDYASEKVDVADVLSKAFDMSIADIHNALLNEELVCSGVNADGSVYTDENGTIVSTANYPGHWFDIEGNICFWGDDAILYCELAHDESSLQLALGHHPENAKVGDEVIIKQIYELNGGKVTFTVNIKIQ